MRPIGKHANRAPGPVNQLDIGGQQIFQAEAVDGVRVAAAHFHEADNGGWGSARRRISSAGLVISSGSRNSSTNFICAVGSSI